MLHAGKHTWAAVEREVAALVGAVMGASLQHEGICNCRVTKEQPGGGCGSGDNKHTLVGLAPWRAA
jgi:hypothetical protein